MHIWLLFKRSLFLKSCSQITTDTCLKSWNMHKLNSTTAWVYAKPQNNFWKKRNQGKRKLNSNSIAFIGIGLSIFWFGGSSLAPSPPPSIPSTSSLNPFSQTFSQTRGLRDAQQDKFYLRLFLLVNEFSSNLSLSLSIYLQRQFDIYIHIRES